MAAYPLQRNQQPYIDQDGIRYAWDETTGKYQTPGGRVYGSPAPAAAPTPQNTPGGYWSQDGQGQAIWVAGHDPSTGYWEDNGQGEAVWKTGAKPTPPEPPNTAAWGTSPAQTSYGWGTGFTGSHAGTTSPFADLTGVQQAYYTKNPDQANYLLRTWLAPNPSGALNQYLGARQGDMTNQFATDTAKTGNGNLQYTDWLKQNFGHYVDQFAGQSATQRGENPLAFGGGFAGRKTFA